MTRHATSRSETASETMSRFDGVRRQRTIATAAQTSELPITVPTMMKTNTASISAERHQSPTTSGGVDAVVTETVTSSRVQLVAMTTTTPPAAATRQLRQLLMYKATRGTVPWVNWFVSPICLVDVPSALLGPIVCWYRPWNCLPSAAGPSRSPDPPSGTACRTMWPLPRLCQLSVGVWNIFVPGLVPWHYILIPSKLFPHLQWILKWFYYLYHFKNTWLIECSFFCLPGTQWFAL